MGLINISEKDFKRKLIKLIREHDGVVSYSLTPDWDGCGRCFYSTLTIKFKTDTDDGCWGINRGLVNT